MIHICVANEIMRKIKLDKRLFILGNLAPDSYNPNNEEYLTSHFRIPEEIMKDECIYLDRFKEKYFLLKPDHFILGYYCHLVTDNEWLKGVYRKYGHLDYDELGKVVKMFYSDYSILNTCLPEVFNIEKIELNIPKTITVEEVNSDYLINIIDAVKNDFSTRVEDKSPKLLDLTEIIEFIQRTAEKCIKDIINYTQED